MATEINYHPGITVRVSETYDVVVKMVDDALARLQDTSKPRWPIEHVEPIVLTNAVTGKRHQLRCPENVTMIAELPE